MMKTRSQQDHSFTADQTKEHLLQGQSAGQLSSTPNSKATASIGSPGSSSSSSSRKKAAKGRLLATSVDGTGHRNAGTDEVAFGQLREIFRNLDADYLRQKLRAHRDAWFDQEAASGHRSAGHEKRPLASSSSTAIVVRDSSSPEYVNASSAKGPSKATGSSKAAPHASKLCATGVQYTLLSQWVQRTAEDIIFEQASVEKQNALSKHKRPHDVETNNDHSANKRSKKGKGRRVSDPLSQGNTMECEICCVDAIPLSEMTQCQEGHVFCKVCARRMAEERIGMQKTDLPCMAMEGCQSVFSEREAGRFLQPKTLQLWLRLRMQEDMKAANLDDLETCPFCDYAVIMEDKAETVFTCLNVTCYKKSCRTCKRALHKGKSCEDLARELSMNDSHRAEEQLTEGLMRRCPKCKTAILKDESSRSCNKMYCSACRCVMCYICRKDITVEGYAHFEENPQLYATSKKCPLWDDTAARHKRDVEEIRKGLGKDAPPNLPVDDDDARRRRQQYEARHGRRAQAVPNEWGFAEDGNGVGAGGLNHPFVANHEDDEEFGLFLAHIIAWREYDAGGGAQDGDQHRQRQAFVDRQRQILRDYMHEQNHARQAELNRDLRQEQGRQAGERFAALGLPNVQQAAVQRAGGAGLRVAANHEEHAMRRARWDPVLGNHFPPDRNYLHLNRFLLAHDLVRQGWVLEYDGDEGRAVGLRNPNIPLNGAENVEAQIEPRRNRPRHARGEAANQAAQQQAGVVQHARPAVPAAAIAANHGVNGPAIAGPHEGRRLWRFRIDADAAGEDDVYFRQIIQPEAEWLGRLNAFHDVDRVRVALENHRFFGRPMFPERPFGRFQNDRVRIDPVDLRAPARLMALPPAAAAQGNAAQSAPAAAPPAPAVAPRLPQRARRPPVLPLQQHQNDGIVIPDSDDENANAKEQRAGKARRIGTVKISITIQDNPGESSKKADATGRKKKTVSFDSTPEPSTKATDAPSTAAKVGESSKERGKTSKAIKKDTPSKAGGSSSPVKAQASQSKVVSASTTRKSDGKHSSSPSEKTKASGNPAQTVAVVDATPKAVDKEPTDKGSRSPGIAASSKAETITKSTPRGKSKGKEKAKMD